MFTASRRTGRRWWVTAAACSAAATALLTSGGFVTRAQSESFETVGIHPGASSQRTAIGKTLGALEAWRGRLYAGYGDYGANTGPIQVSPFDPSTRKFETVHVSDTEAISNWRPIGDRLFAPAIDRRASADYAVGDPWSDVGNINTTHAYDMATIDGGDLWLVGSQGANAAVWHSTDDGASWVRRLAEGPASGLTDDFARFYFAGVFEGKLYVQADDFFGDPHVRSRVFDGTAWSDGPNLLPSAMGWRPVTFAGHMVYRGSERGGPLMRFDGERVEQSVSWNVPDFTVADGELVALTSRRQPAGDWRPGPIVRTSDLETWQALEAPAPDGAASIAVLDGELYVGATEARLLRLAEDPFWEALDGPRWNALPRVRLLAPRPNATFAYGSAVTLLAEADDPNGGLTRVQFWAEQVRLTEATRSPFAAVWTEAPTGTHRILARAIDIDSAMARDYVGFSVAADGNWSPAVLEAVAEPAAPQVGEEVRLRGRAADPDGDAVSLRWLLPGRQDPINGSEAVWTPGGAGDHVAALVAEDAHGAVAVATVAVTVAGRPPQLFFPRLGGG